MPGRSVLSRKVRRQKKERRAAIKLPRALLVVSLLPVSEINQRFRSGYGRTGGVWQAQPRSSRAGRIDPLRAWFTCAPQLEATPR